MLFAVHTQTALLGKITSPRMINIVSLLADLLILDLFSFSPYRACSYPVSQPIVVISYLRVEIYTFAIR
jgi:hypothetical protein